MKSNLELKIKITDTKEYHKIISQIKYEMNELEKENNVLRKALELACEEIDGNQGSLSEVAFDYFIDQAKKEMEE